MQLLGSRLALPNGIWSHHLESPDNCQADLKMISLPNRQMFVCSPQIYTHLGIAHKLFNLQTTVSGKCQYTSVRYRQLQLHLSGKGRRTANMEASPRAIVLLPRLAFLLFAGMIFYVDLTEFNLIIRVGLATSMPSLNLTESKCAVKLQCPGS